MRKTQELKKTLKALAESIRQSKNFCKEYQKTHQGRDDGLYSDINSLKYEFRHKHIAYCLIRGRTRDEIERPAKDNQPCESYIKEIRDAYTEDVCASAS